MLLEFALSLGLAFLLGAAIGMERQWRQKSAGLRTNTLVSVGSAAFLLLSVSLTEGVGDPARIAGQVVTGIGFLGAGVIMKDGFNIQGLNTAATIWCSAAVGALSGVGLFLQSGILTAFIILIHIGLRPIGTMLNKLPIYNGGDNSGTNTYLFTIKCHRKAENQLRVLFVSTIKKYSFLQLRSLKSNAVDMEYVAMEIGIMAEGNHVQEVEELAEKLSIEHQVAAISYKVETVDVEF